MAEDTEDTIKFAVWLPARRPRRQRYTRPSTNPPVLQLQQLDVLSSISLGISSQLEKLLMQHSWAALARLLQFTSCIVDSKPSVAHELSESGAPSVLIGALSQVVSGSAPSLVAGPCVSVLLRLARLSDRCCDATAHPQTLRHLLSLLRAPAVSAAPGWERHQGYTQQVVVSTLHFLATTRNVHKEAILAAGAVPALLWVLQDLSALCDVVLVQEALWTLVYLLDGDALATGRACAADVCSVVVPLLKVYQLPAVQHYGHVSALLLRCLHVVAAGDEVSRDVLRHLGVLHVLVDTIAEGVHAHPSKLDNGADPTPPAPAATASLVSASSLVSSSSLGSHVWGDASRTNSINPHGVSASANGNVGDTTSHATASGTHDGGDRTAGGARTSSPELITADTAFITTLLLRSILIGSSTADRRADGAAGASGGTGGINRLSVPSVAVAVTCLGLLLPTLASDAEVAAAPSSSGRTSSDGSANAVGLRRRLCPLKEGVAMLKTMLCDNPSNQLVAAELGIIPYLVHLVSLVDVKLAWRAVEAMGDLGEASGEALIAAGAVEELTLLLGEAAEALHSLTLHKQNTLTISAPLPYGQQLHRNTGTAGKAAAVAAVSIHSLEHTASSAAVTAAQQAALRRQPDRRSRIVLGGKRQLSYSCYSHSCMYNSHDSSGFCDYCVPSAIMKALLRLTRSDNAEVPTRFVAIGGLRALLLLLQHEISGVHHSKLASSVVSLLKIVVDCGPSAQDEVRKVGGMSVLSAMLLSLMRQGVADIYQLRVAVCKAVQSAVRGNAANKLAVREHGLFQPLMALLRQAAGRENEEVLDDNEQLTAAAIDTLAACLPNSRGNQEVVLGLGGIELLVDLISRNGRSTDVRLAAVAALGGLAGTNPAIQAEVLATPVLERMIQLADSQPSTRMAEAVAIALGSLLKDRPPGAVAAAIRAGAVPLLIKMFNTRPPCAATAAAASVLQMLATEDVDMQNEIASQGGLQTVWDLLAAGPSNAACGDDPLLRALGLLSCLVAGNSFVKNLCRTTGLIRLLANTLMRGLQAVGAAGPGSAEQMEVTVQTAQALAELCQSNHGNQEALADEGGTEAVTELLRAMVGTDLRHASRHAAAAEALLKLLGSMVEFNDTNKSLVREAGGITVVAQLVLLAAEAPDLSMLSRLSLLGPVGAACSCVAKLAQDCPQNQERLGDHGELAPALFRLLSLPDPAAATDAGRALEFLAIRTDLHNADEERSDFEADAIMSLVKLLHSRGDTGAGSTGSTANRISADGGTAVHPRSAMIREAAAIMTQIFVIANAVTAQAASGGTIGGRMSADGGTVVGASRQATASIMGGRMASVRGKPVQSRGDKAAAVTGRADSSRRVGAQVVADPASGLVVLRGTPASAPLDNEHWLQLVGQSAGAFHSISACISEGLWRPFKMQVSWLLFLLSVKSVENRELVLRLERTSVTPLALQMDNAEASAATLMQAQGADQQHQHQQHQQHHPGRPPPPLLAPLSGALPVSTMAMDSRKSGGDHTPVHHSSFTSTSSPTVAGGGGGGGSSRSSRRSGNSNATAAAGWAGGVPRRSTFSEEGEDSEMRMIRQEVALLAGLGLVPGGTAGASSATQQPDTGGTAGAPSAPGVGSSAAAAAHASHLPTVDESGTGPSGAPPPSAYTLGGESSSSASLSSVEGVAEGRGVGTGTDVTVEASDRPANDIGTRGVWESGVAAGIVGHAAAAAPEQVVGLAADAAVLDDVMVGIDGAAPSADAMSEGGVTGVSMEVVPADDVGSQVGSEDMVVEGGATAGSDLVVEDMVEDVAEVPLGTAVHPAVQDSMAVESMVDEVAALAMDTGEAIATPTPQQVVELAMTDADSVHEVSMAAGEEEVGVAADEAAGAGDGMVMGTAVARDDVAKGLEQLQLEAEDGGDAWAAIDV